MKKSYEKPLSELYAMQPASALLENSVELMRSVNGSWDEETN